MKCPKCANELTVVKLGDVEVEECKRCAGIWFDEDELRLAKDSKDDDLRWMDFDLWKDTDQFEINEDSSFCPKCGNVMFEVKYGDTDVTIDSCPQCKGIWLDKDEFQLIINALSKELINKDSREYFNDVLQEAKEIFNGKEGFISEWKDFKAAAKFMLHRINAEKISRSN